MNFFQKNIILFFDILTSMNFQQKMKEIYLL